MKRSAFVSLVCAHALELWVRGDGYRLIGADGGYVLMVEVGCTGDEASLLVVGLCIAGEAGLHWW